MGYVGKVTAGGSTHLVGSTLYGTCSTAASMAAKVVVCSDFTTLVTGVTIHVKFTYSNTNSSPTLNVNSTGAKNLVRYGTTRAGTKVNSSWAAGAVVSFTYDGTSWVMNDYIENTTGTIFASASGGTVYLSGASSAPTGSTQLSEDTVKVDSGVYSANGALHASSYNGYVLGSACESSIGYVASGDTGLVTGGDVYTAIQSAAAGSMQYQGTATSDADLGTSYKAGYYWIVGSGGGTIAAQAVEAGDMVIAHADYTGYLGDDIDIVQANIETITNADIDTIVAS